MLGGDPHYHSTFLSRMATSNALSVRPHTVPQDPRTHWLEGLDRGPVGRLHKHSPPSVSVLSSSLDMLFPLSSVWFLAGTIVPRGTHSNVLETFLVVTTVE